MANSPPPTSDRHTAILGLAVLSTTSGTIGFHFDRRPDLAASASALHESGRRTEGGEDGLGVAAGVRVGVVFAHFVDSVGVLEGRLGGVPWGLEGGRVGGLTVGVGDVLDVVGLGGGRSCAVLWRLCIELFVDIDVLNC